MRFYCNKKRRRVEQLEAEVERLREWHSVFAWMPKRLSDSTQCALFEFVDVKYPYAWIDGREGMESGEPIYKGIEKIL